MKFSINVNKLDNVSIKAVARKYINNFPKEIDQVIVPDINENTDWGDIIKNWDVILHTASIVHDIKGQFKNMPELYWKLNVKGTINLAKQAAKSKVKRLIFLSTIKVNGEFNTSLKPFNAVNNSHKNYKFYPYAFLHRNNVPEDLTDFYILHEGFKTVVDGELEEVDYDDVEEKKFTREASTW